VLPGPGRSGGGTLAAECPGRRRRCSARAERARFAANGVSPQPAGEPERALQLVQDGAVRRWEAGSRYIRDSLKILD